MIHIDLSHKIITMIFKILCSASGIITRWDITVFPSFHFPPISHLPYIFAIAPDPALSIVWVHAVVVFAYVLPVLEVSPIFASEPKNGHIFFPFKFTPRGVPVWQSSGISSSVTFILAILDYFIG